MPEPPPSPTSAPGVVPPPAPLVSDPSFTEQLLRQIQAQAAKGSGFAPGASAGGGGGGGGGGQAQIPNKELVTKFLAALNESPEAVAKFFDRYGEEMDAATWAAIYASMPEERYTTLGEKLVKKVKGERDPAEEARAQVLRGSILSGVYIPDEPTTWEQIKDSIISTLTSSEGSAAFGEKFGADVASQAERKAGEGEETDSSTTPVGELADNIATMGYDDWLDLNPHLAGMDEIPAGTPVFFMPRSVVLGPGETIADLAAKRGVSPETFIAFNERYATQQGRAFDPDNLFPGQKIAIPPEGFQTWYGEQTQPAAPGQPGTGEQQAPGTAIAPPGAEAPAQPGYGPPQAFMAPFGQDYLGKIGLPPDALIAMADDPSRSTELLTMLMNAQYGKDVPGRFGGYLRGQAGNLGDLTAIYNALGIGGGAGVRDPGGSARLFEDLYESLQGGPGMSIGDWRNLVYGGTGAMAPGGLLGGGENVMAYGNPTTLPEAQRYMQGVLMPVLSSTVAPERWAVLNNLLPQLWERYNVENTGQPWAQWLARNGYLPSMAR